MPEYIEGESDLGVLLPGSDPERRKRIKKEINRLKGYILLYSFPKIPQNLIFDS